MSSDDDLRLDLRLNGLERYRPSGPWQHPGFEATDFVPLVEKQKKARR